jgi:hypothetical protein
MPTAAVPTDRRDQRGQVLVLTVLMLVSLIGIIGLAVDVSSAFSTQRFERSITDAASLAGAQDLQLARTRRDPTATDKAKARHDAMQVIVDHLGASSVPDTTCALGFDGPTGCTAGTGLACLTPVGCSLPGTAYWASIRTPSPTCIDCSGRPELAVQVSVWNPSFGLSFARLLGQSQWKVVAASVAAVEHARAYGVISLRPPDPRCVPPACLAGDKNEDDFKIGGGSILNITGDVGTNTNIVYAGTDSLINLTSPDCDPNCDYKGFHYDAYQAPSWVGSPPQAVQIQAVIKDPGYQFPLRTGAPPAYSDKAAALDPDSTHCASEQAKVPLQYKIQQGAGPSIQLLPSSQVFCFRPGIYNFNLSNSHRTDAYLLEPGVYWFDYGLDNSSTIVGGYEGGQPGVALVFYESPNLCPASPQCALTGQTSDLIALNFGSQYLDPSGVRATAAMDFETPQVPVQTSGDSPVLMSLLVARDPFCVVPTSVPASEPSTCIDSKNITLQLPGGCSVFIAGVQYAPSDNVNVKGNCATNGTIGELISWTVKYASSSLNLESAVVEKAGVLRLDRACSPGEICNP